MDLFIGFFYFGVIQVDRVRSFEWVGCRYFSMDFVLFGGNSNCFFICVGIGR